VVIRLCNSLRRLPHETHTSGYLEGSSGKAGITLLFARRPFPAHHARLAPLRFLAVVGLLLAIWACGAGSLNIVITRRPASDLRLALTITGQYSRMPNISIQAQVFEGANPQPVFLASGARLTCDGRDIKPNTQIAVHPCPRQAPGGTYQIAYTDEHGAVTTLLVRVPVGEFAILSPQPGAQVPIPTNANLEVRLALPVPPAGSVVAVDSIYATCWAAPCSAFFLPPAGPPLAAPSTAPVSSPTPGVAATCAPAPQGPRVKLSVGQATITMAGDFGVFQPGPGMIEAAMKVCVTPAHAGFSAATVTFFDWTSAPITWTR